MSSMIPDYLGKADSDFQNVISTHFSTLSSVVALRAFPAVGEFVIDHSRSIIYLRHVTGVNDFSQNTKTSNNTIQQFSTNRAKGSSD